MFRVHHSSKNVPRVLKQMNSSAVPNTVVTSSSEAFRQPKTKSTTLSSVVKVTNAKVRYYLSFLRTGRGKIILSMIGHFLLKKLQK